MAKKQSQKTLTAYIYVEKGKVFWEFRDKEATDTIQELPKLIKEAKLQFYKDKKWAYYWIVRPADKKDRDTLISKFLEHGFTINIQEPKDDDLNLPEPSSEVLTAGRKVATEYKTKEQMSTAAYESFLEVRTRMDEFIAKNGVKTKPGTDDTILIIDEDKWQHQYNQGKVAYNEDFLINWCKKNMPAKIKKVEIIDWDNFGKEEYGELPAEVRSSYENRGEATYKLVRSELNKYNCPQCGEYVGRKAKFCPECGCNLEVEKAKKAA